MIGLFVGMLFESIGIGIILPILELVINPNTYDHLEWVVVLFKTIHLSDENRLVVFLLVFLVLVYLIKAIYLLYLNYFQNRFVSFTVASISNQLYANYVNQPFKFHTKRNSFDLIKIFQVELNYLNTLLMATFFLLTEIAIAVAIISTLIIVEPIGTLVIFMFLLLFGSFYYIFSKNKSSKWGLNRETEDYKISKLLTESLNGINDVIILGKQNFFARKLVNFNHNKAKVISQQVTLGQVSRYYLEFVSIAALTGGILIMFLSGNDLTDMIAIGGVFVAATFRIIPSINRIISSLQQLKFYKSSLNIIKNDLKLSKSKIINSDSEFSYNSLVRLENISFSYSNGNEAIFNDLNFTLPFGQMVGIIGPSGVGKSTLIKLMVGLLEPKSGKLTVDDFKINKEDSAQWRKNIGYVSQNVYLTDSSIRSNVAFGEDESEINNEQVELALEKAQLTTFVENLPDKLDTIVGERGAQLSGGQQQRIGIARALYKNPRLLVLDEATSALDQITENEIIKTITNFKGKITVLIITHRLSTLLSCDKIYKIADKKLIVHSKD